MPAQANRLGQAAAVVAAACLSACVVSACGSSSTAASAAGGSPAKLGPAELVQAADVSGRVAGFKTVISIQEQVPSIGTVSIDGTGSFSQSRVGALTMNINFPQIDSTLGTLQMAAVLDRTTEYVKLPAIVASRFAGAKPWIEIDFAHLGGSAEASALSTLMTSSSQMSNPAQYFFYLKAITAGTLQNLGSQTVDGVQTTHYRGDEDLTQLASLVPAAQRASVQQAIASIRGRTGLARAVPVQAWIDSRSLVRRIIINETINDAGQPATLRVQEDFPQYGPQPAPAIPAASEVTNISSLAGASGL